MPKPKRATRLRRPPAPPAPTLADATPERIAKDPANDIVPALVEREIDRRHKVRRFNDSWLERMRRRQVLSYPQWYACDWYARLYARAMTTPRVTASYGEGSGSVAERAFGTPRSEAQARDRTLLRGVRAALPAQMLGLFEAAVVHDQMPAFAGGLQRQRFERRIADVAQRLAILIEVVGVSETTRGE